MRYKYAIMFLLAAIMLGGCGRHASDSDRELTATQIADRVRPAMVQVVVQVKTDGNMVQLDLDRNRLLSDLRNNLYGNSVTPQQAFDVLFNLFAQNPGSYLVEGVRTKMNNEFTGLGSGFIITPDGYILTNAHVVEPSEEDLQKAVISSISGIVENQVKQFASFVADILQNYDINDLYTAKLVELFAGQDIERSHFQFSRDVAVILPNANGAAGEPVKVMPCEVLKIGEATPGKDVAVLKAPGNDLPTVPLAASIDAGGIRTGAPLYVMGYPGKLALAPMFKLQSRAQPSLTTGHVSGIKDMSGGWQDIQMDAAINPGNSGGPVLNARGQVVGLATFQIIDTQGVNFAISIDLAQQFVRALGVQPRESEFTRKYSVALHEYEKRGHGSSLRLFRELAAAYPNISAPREFVNELSAEQGGDNVPIVSKPVEQRTKHPAEGHSRFPIIVILVFGIVLLAGVVFLISAKRK